MFPINFGVIWIKVKVTVTVTKQHGGGMSCFTNRLLFIFVSQTHCSGPLVLCLHRTFDTNQAVYVSSTQGFRVGGHWFNPVLAIFLFERLMIVIDKILTSVSMLTIVLRMALSESSQWFGNNIIHVHSSGNKNSRKGCIGALATVI